MSHTALLLNKEIILLPKNRSKELIHVGFTDHTVNPITQEKMTLKMVEWLLEDPTQLWWKLTDYSFYNLEGCLMRRSICFEEDYSLVTPSFIE